MKSSKRIKAGVKLGCTLQPVAHATDNTRPDDGSNHHAESFDFVTSMILKNMNTFSLNDAYSLCRNIDGLENFQEVEKLFNRWTRKALCNGQIVAVPSCYEQAVFQVV